MIIGQVMRSFRGGGAQRSAINLALGLAELGHESRIVALGEPGDFAAQVRDRIPCDSLGIASLFQAVSRLGRLRRLIRERGFDVLHVHGSGVLPVVAAALRRGGRLGPSLHFTWHDSGSVLGGAWPRTRMTRWGLSHCDSVTGSSASVALRLALAWGRGQVEVMRNGIPDGGILGDPESSVPRVVWAARIVPEKRPDWFIRLAAEAKSAGLPSRFVLAGAPLPRHQSYFDSIRALASDLGDPVEFVGWIEDSESLLRGAAIGVQTSKTEGLSMALLEQMMAGLAIVATDVGDTGKALDGGNAGLLVDADHEKALRMAVLSLLSDPRRRKLLAQLARKTATREYSCRAAAARALRLYRGMTA